MKVEPISHIISLFLVILILYTSATSNITNITSLEIELLTFQFQIQICFLIVSSFRTEESHEYIFYKTFIHRTFIFYQQERPVCI